MITRNFNLLQHSTASLGKPTRQFVARFVFFLLQDATDSNGESHSLTRLRHRKIQNKTKHRKSKKLPGFLNLEISFRAAIRNITSHMVNASDQNISLLKRLELRNVCRWDVLERGLPLTDSTSLGWTSCHRLTQCKIKVPLNAIQTKLVSQKWSKVHYCKKHSKAIQCKAGTETITPPPLHSPKQNFNT